MLQVICQHMKTLYECYVTLVLWVIWYLHTYVEFNGRIRFIIDPSKCQVQVKFKRAKTSPLHHIRAFRWRPPKEACFGHEQKQQRLFIT